MAYQTAYENFLLTTKTPWASWPVGRYFQVKNSGDMVITTIVWASLEQITNGQSLHQVKKNGFTFFGGDATAAQPIGA